MNVLDSREQEVFRHNQRKKQDRVKDNESNLTV